MTTTDLDQLSINTIRTLSMDAVQQANSGHPGTPMAMAPVAYELWQNHLRFDPNDPVWPDRDRFVLSIGHASMLLYSLLHVAGIKAVNDDVGIRWLYSFLSADKKKTYCLYEAPSAEAIREAAARLGIPADEIVPVEQFGPAPV